MTKRVKVLERLEYDLGGEHIFVEAGTYKLVGPAAAGYGGELPTIMFYSLEDPSMMVHINIGHDTLAQLEQQGKISYIE